MCIRDRPFAGYILPVQYKAGVIKEHMAVRQEAGLFDVSHMGEILCEGEKALENLQHLLTNDFTNMVDGQARYSPMCNEHGGTVDDLIVYKKADNHYFIVVNAANKDKMCIRDRSIENPISLQLPEPPRSLRPPTTKAYSGKTTFIS